MDMSYLRTEKMQRQQNARRNLNPHREARLAMLVWHGEYAAQRGGSMDFYDRLTAFQKRQLRQWCNELEATPRGRYV